MRAELANTKSLELAPNSSASLLPMLGRGEKGEDGSNVLPTDTAMANGVNNSGGAYPLFSAALSASFDATLLINRTQTMNLRKEVTPSGVNDTAAVNTALAAFAAAGGGKVIIPRDDWVFTGSTGVALTGTANPIHIEAEPGTVFDMTGMSATANMKLGGSATATSAALGADAVKGADTITCATVAAAVSAGDILQIASTDIFDTLQSRVKGESAEVLSVAGSVITLRSALWDSYTAATTTVTKLQMPRVSVENLALLHNANNIGLQIAYARDVLLGGCYSQGARVELFEMTSVFGGTADGLVGRDFWYSGGANCYGLVVSSSQHIREIGLDFRGGRHAVAHGGTYPTRDVETIGGTFDNYHASGVASFDYHGNVEAVSLMGATVLNGIICQAVNAHIGGGSRIKGFNKPAIEIGPGRSADYTKVENVDIESNTGYNGIEFTARNGSNATTLGLLKIDATIRAGANGVKIVPNSSADTGATIDRLVIRGDITSAGAFAAVQVSKSSSAYVGINEAELDGRFKAPGAASAANFQGTSTGPAKMRGHFETAGNGQRVINCAMFGDVSMRHTTLKGTDSPFRNLFTNAGGLYLSDVVIDGSFTNAFEASGGPTEVMQSNVRRVNGAGAPLLPARHFSRITETGSVITSGTAAPTTGTWAVGDYCTNTNAGTSGQPDGWVCTVAGTPGTWVSGPAPNGAFGSAAITTTGLATLGSALIGVSAQNPLTVVSTGSVTGAAASQIVARAGSGGYGAGITFQSTETGTSTVQPQATIEAEGEGSWNSVANAKSFLRFSTASGGTLSEAFRIKANGDLLGIAGKSVRLPAGAGVVQTGQAVTGSRPAAATAGAGAMFYDTTLSKPIWSDGTTWRDSAGTAV